MQHRYEIRDMIIPTVGSPTDDPIEILRYGLAALQAGIPVALVTLVEIRGGSARPIGSQMVVRGDGLYCGFVSGGCTENVVATEAIEALTVGHDRFLKLGQGSPFFDIVLPCGGGINLSIHLLQDTREIETAICEMEARRAVTLRYSPSDRRLSVERKNISVSHWLDGDFLISYKPCTRLLICGRSIEASATENVAKAAGMETYLVDSQTPQDALASLIDGYTAVAILFHDLERELPILRCALDRNPFYIGALGSRRTHGRRTDALTRLGYGEADNSRIKAPIGIFDKARNSSSLAISVVADVAAARLAAL